MTRMDRYLFIAVIAIVAAAPSFAAGRTDNAYADIKKMLTAEKNYIHALKIGNEGVKISAAGYLADYRMTGSVPALVEVLHSDKVENVRISAALSLIMLDDKEGRQAVEESSLYDGSDRVARFCEALLQVHDKKGADFAEE
jgi:hypothetical protein